MGVYIPNLDEKRFYEICKEHNLDFIAIPATDVVTRDCYDRLLAENDRLRSERPVVRCGECKHCVGHYDTDGNAPYWVCKEWDSGTDYDGYCHYGEKNEP